MMENKTELIKVLALTELRRHSFLNSYRERQMLKEGQLTEVAQQQLEKISILFWVEVAFILIFSAFGVYQLINFGETNDLFSLILGLASWIMMVIFTYFFTKEIVSKRRSLEIVIELLDT
ncbi:MAG: hypothetical protein U5K69_11140 [Balneolaceae bacterium]|nr:hypothetical protein [Balneolaceae bacterium]